MELYCVQGLKVPVEVPNQNRSIVVLSCYYSAVITHSPGVVSNWWGRDSAASEGWSLPFVIQLYPHWDQIMSMFHSIMSIKKCTCILRHLTSLTLRESGKKFVSVTCVALTMTGYSSQWSHMNASRKFMIWVHMSETSTLGLAGSLWMQMQHMPAVGYKYKLSL